MSNSSEAQSKNDCAGIWWGAVPNSIQCDKYYLCTLLVSNERQCDADMIFNPQSSECVPGNSVTCEIFDDLTETSSEPSTSSFTTKTFSTDLEEICKGIFFAARPLPDSESIYVGCIRGTGVLYHCLDGEQFDNDLNECIDIPTTPPTTTTEATTSTRSPPNLETICNGLYFNFIPFPEDCSQYIFCYQQRAGIFQCESGKIFDVITGR